jgi:hypothetical protein
MNIPTIENYHIIKVMAIGATNTNPAKVKIITERFRQSLTIPYTNHPGASSPSIDTALLYLTGKGFEIVGKGEGKDHMYLITTTFEPIK